VYHVVLVEHAVALHQLERDVKNGSLDDALPKHTGHLMSERSAFTQLHKYVVVVVGEATAGPRAHDIGVGRQLLDYLQLPLDNLTLLLVSDLDHLNNYLLLGLLGIHCAVDNCVATLPDLLVFHYKELPAVVLRADELDVGWLHIV